MAEQKVGRMVAYWAVNSVVCSVDGKVVQMVELSAALKVARRALKWVDHWVASSAARLVASSAAYLAVLTVERWAA